MRLRSICRCIQRRELRSRSPKKVRLFNPSAQLCAYGLYAPMNASYLKNLGILGGEFEEELTSAIIEPGQLSSPEGSTALRSRPPSLLLLHGRAFRTIAIR